MKNFADLLEKLAETPQILEKKRLLINYIASTPDPDRGYAVGLLTGAIRFPLINSPLLKSILPALPHDTSGQTLPRLTTVITLLTQLPKETVRQNLIYLLTHANNLEKKALLTIFSGNLRVGVSARFVKNTLAQYGGVSAQDVEKAWHGLSPPYCELFAWLEKKAEPPTLQQHLFFQPVMLSHPLTEKMLASLDVKAFAIEKKLDGIRVQAVSLHNEKALFSRTGDNISSAFPDVLPSITGDIILDGELVIIRDGKIQSFNDLQQRLNRKKVTTHLLETYPAGLILYDILYKDAQDLRHLPFKQRRTLLEQWAASCSHSNILLSDLLSLEKEQSLKELREAVLNEKHPAVEGLMLKAIESPYLAGRPRGYWYKWKKDPFIIDAVVLYAQRGQGKRSAFYSDYTFGLWSKGGLLPVGKAYFGFTDAELKQLDNWVREHQIKSFGPVIEVEKKLVLEIAFDAVQRSPRHSSGVALRFPRVNRIRWDKPAQEADELEALLALLN